MATKNTQSRPISPVAPPESSLQQFMRLQSTFAPKPIAPPTFPITTGIDDLFGSQAQEEPLIPQRMEAAPYQYAGPVQEKQRPFGYKPSYGQVTEDPGLTPERQIPLPQQPDANDVMQRFRDTVLNPPQRQHMTYPDSTLGALDAGFKIAATPTDYEKNRVYVDGQAYQQAKQFIDPVTGEVKYINKYKQPGFMEQVLKAVPAGLPAVTDILNQPYKDSVEDWKMQSEGLGKALTAESQMALSQQRQAQARAIPINADVRQMDAQTRQYLASLKDLPESTKLQMIQSGQLDLAAYQASQRYSLQELIGDQALTRTQVTGAYGLGRQQSANQAAAQRQQVAGSQAIQQIGAREAAQGRLQQSQGAITAQQIAQRGELAQRLEQQRAKDALVQKAAPGWSAVNQSNSQQKIALQDRAMEVANATPGLAEHITFNDQGFPVIDPELDPQTASDVYEAIYGEAASNNNINIPQLPPNPLQPQQPTAPIQQPVRQPAAPIQAPNAPAIPPAAGGPSGGQGAIPMIAPDGRSVRMVKPSDVPIAESQGYRKQ